MSGNAWASRAGTQLCTGTAACIGDDATLQNGALRTSLELITKRRGLPRSSAAGYPRALQPAVREQVPARFSDRPAVRPGRPARLPLAA
jgi:hypothetical protein